MTIRDRESLIARVRSLRRVAATADTRPTAPVSEANTSGVQALETRVAHLEQLLEGLQDSVYREAERQCKKIAELEARIEPGALGAALSHHARERGL